MEPTGWSRSTNDIVVPSSYDFDYCKFAGSKVEFAMAALDVDSEFTENYCNFLSFLVMYIELSSGVIRFSMLDANQDS